VVCDRAGVEGGAMKIPWIIACDGTHPEYKWGFACERCGVKECIPPTMTLTNYIRVAKEFAAKHRACKP
jgi:hypothetical protein